jgi:hypothetical protein
MGADAWINLGGVAIAALGIVVAGIWQLTRSEGRVTAALAQTEIRIQGMIAEHRVAVQELMEADRRTTAESIQAVRQKINDLEVKSLETFVRRDSFNKFLDMISEARAAFESDIKARLTELQRKLDRLVERDNERSA